MDKEKKHTFSKPMKVEWYRRDKDYWWKKGKGVKSPPDTGIEDGRNNN